MDTRKLQEAIKELEDEGANCLRVAADLKSIVARSARMNGAAPATADHPSAPSSKKPDEMSWLELGMAVLSENGGKLHMKKLLPLVWQKSGKNPARANVEGALIRGIKQGKVARVQPGTYALVTH